MKKFLYSAAILIMGLTAITACSSEDDITPSGNYSPLRGPFPQGDSEYDDIILDISKEYGVYLLYKDVTEQDLNRDWVSTGTGDLYVAGAEEERHDGAWNLPLEQLPFYVNYFNEHIFPNITKEFAKSTFPVKIYMINNLRREPRIFGDDAESNVGSTITDPFVSIKLGNFDNWAISFKDEVINGANAEYQLKQQRCIFMIELLKNSIEKGEIDSPDEFWEGFDFSADKKMNHDNPSKSNYKYKLGFLDMINDNFGTGPQKQVWVSQSGETSCYYWEKGKYPHYDLFTTYLKNAMWLTPEEFAAKYNPSRYPMVHEKYNIIVNHMKEVYGLDIVGMARGPQE